MRGGGYDLSEIILSKFEYGSHRMFSGLDSIKNKAALEASHKLNQCQTGFGRFSYLNQGGVDRFSDLPRSMPCHAIIAKNVIPESED